jgi:hypothetical protein
LLATFNYRYRLAADSRLPSWLTLPPGAVREDVSVSLRYLGNGSVIIRMITGSGVTSVTATLERLDALRPGGAPRRDALTVNGVTEIIEYRSDGREFHVAGAGSATADGSPA